MPRQLRVLVVDDDRYLSDLVAMALRHEGFEVDVASSGRVARERVMGFRPDLVVLDVMLPDGSGFETCRRLRRDADRTPIVFLTAKDSTEDKIAGLTIGGDDYLTKPFSLEELVVRIRTVLRRTIGEDADPDAGRLVYADLEIDEDRYQVTRNGRVIELSPTEFKLLRYLVSNAGKVLTKRRILDHVWDYESGGSAGLVQTYISYLRRKVDAEGPPLIHTISRVGYSIRLD